MDSNSLFIAPILSMFCTFFLIDRPIASIAFHAKGEFLAVASGHKVLIFALLLFILAYYASYFHFIVISFILSDSVTTMYGFLNVLALITFEVLFQLYIWNYSKKTAPAIVLKTRRSLRAIHFHPHAAPFLLTAEVCYQKCDCKVVYSLYHVGFIIGLICRSMILTLQIPQ